MFEKLVAMFVLCGAVFLVGYLSMTLGWGLEVKSWFWILLPIVANPLLIGAISALAKDKK